MNNYFSLQLKTKVEFGNGVIQLLPDYINKYNGKNVLIVTDKGIVSSGLLKPILNHLEKSNISYEIFQDVESNPSDEVAEKGAMFAKNNDVDILVAIGGGSSIDAAKAISILLSHNQKLIKYEGYDTLTNDCFPVIAIPTTAGTGSEVTIWTVITNNETKKKFAIGSEKLAPVVALVDPELTYTLPPGLTSSTGIDALTHAIEAYTSKRANIITDQLALEAIRLIAKYIKRATYNSHDYEAKSAMLLASLIAGIAFNNSDLGAVHCMSEAVGGLYNTPHGVTNAVLLPYVMEYNAVVCEEKMAKISEVMGVNVSNKDNRQKAKLAVETVKQICQDLKIPTFKELGAKIEDFKLLANRAMENVSLEGNPRDMKEDDFYYLFMRAYEGN